VLTRTPDALLASPMPRGVLVGIGLTIVSAFAFGSGALFAKPVYAAGVGWHVLLARRFLIGAVLAPAASPGPS